MNLQATEQQAQAKWSSDLQTPHTSPSSALCPCVGCVTLLATVYRTLVLAGIPHCSTTPLAPEVSRST